MEIFSVSLDKQPHDWAKAISEDGMIWKHGIDPNSQIAGLYCLKSIPCMILLDENNRIIAKNLRGAQLQKKVAELLKK